MRRLAGAAALMLMAGAALAGCGGDENGGDTTVIREAPEAQTETTTVQEEAPKPKPAPEAEAEAEAEPEPAGVPDVVGFSLPSAKKELKAAGYDVKVSGGGLFGVVVESNWQVCSQTQNGDTIEVNVDRSC